MKKGIISLIFMLSSSCAFAQDYFELGKKEFYNNNYIPAQKLFLQELQRNPDNYPCRYFLAHTYVYNGNQIQAKEEYNKIITFAPTKTLQKLAMQSLYNLNHQSQTKNIKIPQNNDNYYEHIKLDGNYVKWENFPIQIYVQPSDYTSLIKTAFTHWQKLLGGTIKFNFTNNFNTANIIVKMVETLENDNQPGFEAGKAQIFAKNNIIYKAQIQLLQFNPKTKLKIPNEVIYSTALHEIAHAMGIQGHSPNDSDLMSAVNNYGVKKITTRDLNTLKMLYK